jgi:hypothetical protein
MRQPALPDVLADIGRMVELLDGLRAAYRTAYADAYSTRASDMVGVRSIGGDPTGSLAVSDGKAAARARVVAAGEHIADAVASLRGARGALAKSHGDTSRDPMKPDRLPPRSVTRDELRGLHAAAGRRAGRGDE